MEHTIGLRRWRLLLWTASLTIIFGVVALSHPEATSAGAMGCSEKISCATESACADLEGEPCEEGECLGTQTCAGDPHEECNDGPACDLYECEVLLCVDWGPS